MVQKVSLPIRAYPLTVVLGRDQLILWGGVGNPRGGEGGVPTYLGMVERFRGDDPRF